MSQPSPALPKPLHAFLISPAALAETLTCTLSQTLIIDDGDPDSVLVQGVTCKTWACRFCAQVKIRKLSWLCNNATPNRLMTLTVDPAKWTTPRAAFESTAPFVPETIRALRKRFGPVEYLRVTEQCQNGYPHYHLLLRSGFLPQPVVKSLWTQYTGATIVDLRKVSDSFRAYTYLLKYLTKLHRLDWTERHVSYSKAFFRPEDLEKTIYPKSQIHSRDSRHPHVWLCDNLQGTVAQVVRPGVYRVLRDCAIDTHSTDPAVLRLPRAKDSPFWPKVQQSMTPVCSTADF